MEVGVCSKVCKKCEVEKSLTDFYRDANGRLGRKGICKKCQSVAHKEFHDSTKDKYYPMARARRDNNEYRKKHAERNLARYYKDKHYAFASSGKRRARKLNATPSWANSKSIRAFYKTALHLSETTGLTYHVDHIIPLQGKLVCGLHVENNLQVIPEFDNISKGNRFNIDLEPPMPCTHLPYEKRN